ncbi:hypothetical protein JAU75_12770 [Ochrobactrum sp. Q0168]|uniref:hypothetical protein n=1 Tax=Ochrobactrum sp. Q0168 TaxID=2793241 RepID=UPI0018EB8576|nr:hypothetical protein [Ochrobactrum sp. Q0168]
MTIPVLDFCQPAAAPVFLNFRSEAVRPVCFAIVYWDGPGDTLYAFGDRNAFERQRAAAERQFAHVQELSVEEAVDWVVAGGKAVLHEVSTGGVAVFCSLKLAADGYGTQGVTET